MPNALTTAAESDLDDILDYSWSRFGAAQARRYYFESRETLDLLAASPLIARERTDLSPPVRIHPHGRHLIGYRTAEGGILVLRVLHQSTETEGRL